ncbi:hypothetical protein F3Y22_tig00116951pilonHSYRG00036 [Hibiscus syriacus]|uniref:Uncharacterized protein n=1 Tax=Hibiscus syriacus TaxID=106335 RepID=A0A6A2WXX8_HIBSY|nr:hypothetical protein F3Y22_tig00116951pilonHSYRG00036 [Hibiscus syriacus]
MNHLLIFFEVYSRVKVRVQEEEEDHFPPQNDDQSSMYLRLIESLSKQEKENKIKSPPSNSAPRVTKAYHYQTSPTPRSLSASKDVGTIKNKKQIGKNFKSNVKTSSVPPPRSVLSSPDNDVMIGNINELDYERSSASKKRAVDIVNPSSAPKAKTENVNRNPIISRCSPKTDIVSQSPKITRSYPNRGLTGRIRKKDPLQHV